MIGHGAKFAHKMEQAIAALLSHKSMDEAARAVGVSTNTLLRWMKQPEFRATYREARGLAFSQSIGRLQEASGAAVTTTLKIMLDANAPPGIRLRAAEIVFEQAGKAAEVEKLGRRLAQRERKEHRRINPTKVTLVKATPLLGPSPTQPARDLENTEPDDGGETE